ncbi:Bax inhibitor-1/YccA family protein [Companilactobacillus suantsaicola]|uniref:Bax inhibitor-1/YccA family protein n=1 Tax=Companilactobacillus suantsaicola TaxID=2487723 RepID=A0A4Z0JH00_9LACO|nr:Bax inhibitor-1/YccA family protein [Companilactobacillus suantsaicola]TGD21550.1 Bax inhibitor-1/YccA family protein [Companilactobacillus suantsaicola]
MQSIDKVKATGLARFTSLVYLYTGLGIAFWMICAQAIANNQAMSAMLFQGMANHRIISMILMIAVPIGFISLCARFATRSYFLTFVSYLGFLFALSFMGVPIFYLYSAKSIIQTLTITSAVFVVSAFVGFMTKKDLTKWSRTLMIGLLSVIVIEAINIFIFKSTAMMMLVSAAIVILFLFYIAFDSQNIKRIYQSNAGSESLGAIALLASVNLVMDFINLFLSIIQIFGDNN